MSITLGIPSEAFAGEARVAATPDTAKKAIALGLEVLVEAGAGSGAGYPDEKYSEIGALNGEADWVGKIGELMDAVDAYVEEPVRDNEKPFLMPIEDVFTITGRGTVATGRIETGVANTGDAVDIIGMGAEKL